MDVVLHPVNDRFLSRVVFPALEQGCWQVSPALRQLADSLGDERVRLKLEQLLERGVDGSAFALESELWRLAAHRLLFSEWGEGPDGWVVKGHHVSFAASLDSALHLSMMLEDREYPYDHVKTARLLRKEFLAVPDRNMGVASLLCGAWKDLPKFQPDLVLKTQGRARYAPSEGLAVADWSYRSASAVVAWNMGLPQRLQHLLERESARLQPLDLPEAPEILDYWNGKAPQPPALAVAYSGLGPEAALWVRELGELAAAVRRAAQSGHALVSLVTRGSAAQDQ